MDMKKDIRLPAMRTRSYSRLDFLNALAEGKNQQLMDSHMSGPWSGSLLGNPAVSSLCNSAALDAPIWRTPSQNSSKTYPYCPTEESFTLPEVEGDYGLPRTALATPQGTISLRLSHGMRVDITIDRAIRLINFKSKIIMAMNPTGSSCALLHPNGRVLQTGSRVEIMAHDSRGNNHKYAKMWFKGVSFTSANCALVYLVDSAGTRTTTDTFSDLSHDFSVGTFYTESSHGRAQIPEAVNIIQAMQYFVAEDGVEHWIINNVKISQASDGLVKLEKNNGKYQLRTSPSNGSASVTTPFVHCTASLGPSPHLFVRRGERRMHFDGTVFIVRNAGHSAGFDDKTQLKVY